MLRLDQFFRPFPHPVDLGTAYPGAYDGGLVILSLAIASLSAFVAFSVSERVAAIGTTRSRAAWSLAGALVMGGGIWAMHFIGMLAFSLPCGVGYDPIETVLSMLPGILSSGAAINVISRAGPPTQGRMVGGALLMGGGIGAMHYWGMAAMRPEALLLYDTDMVVVSVLIAVVLAFLSLQIHFRLRRTRSWSATARKLLAAIVMGLAVAGMHYVAMAAALFYPAFGVAVAGLQLPPTLLAMLIAVIAVLIASATLAASFAGRQADLIARLSDEATRRSAVEREAQRARARTQAIVDSVADAIVTIDRSGRIQQWSRGAERIFGYSADEVIGADVTTLMPAPHRARHPRYVNAFMTTRDAKIIGIGRELTAIRKDGSEFPIDLTVTEVSGIDEVLFTGIMRDITDRKRAEQELIDARQLAEAASRAKTEFLATMSHEIRTPMNGVLGMANLLASTPLNERQNRLTENLQRSGQALMGIINDVLDFSKAEAGRLELVDADFEPREVVAEVADLFGERCADKGLELVYFIDEAVPTSVRGDPMRLRQVCVNLLGNAIKFTERGEILIEMTAAEAPDDQVMLQVAVVDSGIGIAAEKRAAVFDSFHQVDSSMTRRRGGSGLGLAIVKQLVELMGGTVAVESELGRGSRFSFTVQLRKTAAETAAPRGGRHIERKLSLLLVDANAVSAHVISHYMMAWGIEPSVHAGADEAYAAWQDARTAGQGFDVAVIDVKALGAPGLELVARMRADDAAKAPAIILLAGLEGYVAGGAEPEVFATLSKPVRPSELFDCLASIASGGRTRRNPLAFARRGRGRRTSFDARILVAEDNAINQDVAVGMLTNMGCRVVTAPNGRAALQAFAQDRFDLILMDCEMPVMDGFEATKRIRDTERLMNELPENRDQPNRIPIVAVTAHALAEMRDRCIEAGMDDFVTKPFDDLQLAEALLRHLRPVGVVPQPIPGVPMAVEPVADKPADVAATKPIDTAVVDQIRTIEARGSHGLLASIIGKFAETAPAAVADITAKFDAGDSEALWRAAHGLKSSASVVGAARVAKRCAAIELAARSGVATAADVAELGADVATAVGLLRDLSTDADATVD